MCIECRLSTGICRVCGYLDELSDSECDDCRNEADAARRDDERYPVDQMCTEYEHEHYAICSQS